MEEEQILEEFTKVKECLSTNHMDEDEFEAARETCLVLGGKLGAIRRKQDRKLFSTKEGSLHEDIGIMAAIHELISGIPTLRDEVGIVLRSLVEVFEIPVELYDMVMSYSMPHLMPLVS